MIAFAAIAPHGEVDETPELHVAMSELGRRFDASGCDVAVVLTPHNVHVEGHFAVVTAGKVGEHEVDRVLAVGLRDEIRAAGLPVVGVSYGGNDEAAGQMPLDWGTRFRSRSCGPRASSSSRRPATGRSTSTSPWAPRSCAPQVNAGRRLWRAPITGTRTIRKARTGSTPPPQRTTRAFGSYSPPAARLPPARRARRRGEGRLALAARGAPGSGRRRSRAARVRDADLLRHGRRRDCLALTQPGCRATWLQGLRSLRIARRSQTTAT